MLMSLSDCMELTGESSIAANPLREHTHLQKNAFSSDYNVTGFIGYSGTADNDQIQQAKTGYFDDDSNYNENRINLTSQRYTLNSAIKKAVCISEALSKAAESDNVLDILQHKELLKDQLRKLWKLKSLRDEYWQRILNYIIISLTERGDQALTLVQCNKLALAIRYGLASGSAANKDVVDTVASLRKAKFNPFALISLD